MKTRKRRIESDMDSLHKYRLIGIADVGPVPHDGEFDLGKNGKVRITESNETNFSELNFHPHNDAYCIRKVVDKL